MAGEIWVPRLLCRFRRYGRKRKFRKLWYLFYKKGGQGGHLAMGGGSGGRTVVSKSTSTKTSTKNGIKTVIKTTKLKYSDGTE